MHRHPKIPNSPKSLTRKSLENIFPKNTSSKKSRLSFRYSFHFKTYAFEARNTFSNPYLPEQIWMKRKGRAGIRSNSFKTERCLFCNSVTSERSQRSQLKYIARRLEWCLFHRIRTSRSKETEGWGVCSHASSPQKKGSKIIHVWGLAAATVLRTSANNHWSRPTVLRTQRHHFLPIHSPSPFRCTIAAEVCWVSCVQCPVWSGKHEVGVGCPLIRQLTSVYHGPQID